jgi:hypothetical protein
MKINRAFVKYTPKQIYIDKLKASLTDDFIESFIKKNMHIVGADSIYIGDAIARRNFVARMLYHERFKS